MKLSPAAPIAAPTASPNPLPRGRATTHGAIAVAAVVLFSTTLVLSALASQREERGGDPVEPNRGLGFLAVLASGEAIQVYPAARNRARTNDGQANDGIEDDVYLYLPRLALERDSQGQLVARQMRNERVEVRLQGTSPNITAALHDWLADEGLLNPATRLGSRSVRPLAYNRIRVFDTAFPPDAWWEAVYPVSDEVTPVAQEWIPFVFTRLEGASESPRDFMNRLNDPDRLRSLTAHVSYGGRTIELASRSLTASSLRETDFLVDLKGDGGREFVTRDQARGLLSKYLTEVSQTIYTEGPVTLDGDWLESLFRQVTMSADEFWSSEDNLRRVGFSGDDLAPERHLRMREQTARELLDDSNDKLSVETSSYWKRGPSTTSGGGGFSLFGIGVNANASRTRGGGGAGESERIDKEEFTKRLQSDDSSFEWDGVRIVPKDVELHQVDEARFNTATRLASVSVRTFRARETLAYSINNTLPREASPPPPPPPPPLPDPPARRGVGDVFRDCAECPELVVVPGGSSLIGPPGFRARQHTVTFPSAFAVGVYEVTFSQWDACVSGGGCDGYRPHDGGWGRGSRPVMNVNWHHAQSYVDWLSRETGADYRLLSESEWEHVARAGTATRYWWGDSVGRNRANCDGCGSRWGGTQTAPVGAFAANGFGVHDVSGNVWEWVEDCALNRVHAPPSDGSAVTVRSGGDCQLRMMRGGSWDTWTVTVEVGNRYSPDPTTVYASFGFRVSRRLD